MNENNSAVITISRIVQANKYYTPHPNQIIFFINNLSDPDLYIYTARSIKHFDLQLAHSSLYSFQELAAKTPLGLLLLIYQPEYDESIKLLISKGAKLIKQDLIILIAIANKINPAILELLLANHTIELNSPLIGNYHIFHFLSLQRFISPLLIDFILSRLDPNISYHWQKSGIQLAQEHNHYPLLYYFYKKGHIPNPLDIVPTLAQVYQAPQTTITDDFPEAVKLIKKQYNFKSLKKWLPNKENGQIAPNYALFLVNPTIGNFLGRNTIMVNQFQPTYVKQELSFYIAISTLFKIPFRSDGTALSNAQTRLETGTTPDTKFFMYQNLKRDLPIKNNFLLIPVSDIMDLSEQLYALKTLKINNEKYIYVFFLVSNNNHALFILSIIDTKTEKILSHIIINSWQDLAYINQLNATINCGKTHDKHPGIPKIYDASLQTQTHQDDVYCTSHSLEIANALYSALYINPELRQIIEDFASTENQEQQWTQLKDILHREIKTRLPMFFDQTSNTLKLRAQDDMINWHIQNRFSYGSTFINQLRKDSEIMIKENQEAIQKMQRPQQ